MKTKYIIGTLLLISCFILFFILLAYLPKWIQTNNNDNLTIDSIRSEQVYRAMTYIEKNNMRHYTVQKDTIALFLHPFDPNKADSIELLQMGFKPWMASNMLKYRRKNGIYKKKEDLKKIYGMDSLLYTQIMPFISIDSSLFLRDTLPKKMYVSHKKDTIIELNNCDTTDLMCLKGIGKYKALAILKYKKELGGYAYVEQIKEIEIIKEQADSLFPYLRVEKDSIKQIPINKSSVERLQRHPYISFQQAKAIYEYRRKKVKIKCLDELYSLPELNEETIQKINPYLTTE